MMYAFALAKHDWKNAERFIEVILWQPHAHGRDIFMDIVKGRTPLYQCDITDLHQPKPKTLERAVAME